MNIDRQGDLDGFCGLYCLVHFLRQIKVVTTISAARNAFWYLIESAEELNLNNIIYICKGLEHYHLIDIADRTFKKYHLDYMAIPLARLELVKGSSKNKLERVVSEGGYAVVSANNDSHWVLALRADDGGILVADPADGKEKLKHKFDNPLDGLAILPINSPLAVSYREKNNSKLFVY